jgi:hypothetical protein
MVGQNSLNMHKRTKRGNESLSTAEDIREKLTPERKREKTNKYIIIVKRKYFHI